MSGFYQNWIKVQNPDAILPQMDSEGYKKPFYFGGSRVPIDLNLDKNQYSGSGIKNKNQIILKPTISKNRQITGVSNRSMKPNYLPMTMK